MFHQPHHLAGGAGPDRLGARFHESQGVGIGGEAGFDAPFHRRGAGKGQERRGYLAAFGHHVLERLPIIWRQSTATSSSGHCPSRHTRRTATVAAARSEGYGTSKCVPGMVLMWDTNGPKAMEILGFLMVNGAVEKTRTSTGCPTATSTLRVYQFRHDRPW